LAIFGFRSPVFCRPVLERRVSNAAGGDFALFGDSTVASNGALHAEMLAVLALHPLPRGRGKG
jgi:hypothetical protein